MQGKVAIQPVLQVTSLEEPPSYQTYSSMYRKSKMYFYVKTYKEG